MTTANTPDELPSEIDFSGGVRGKFFSVGTMLKLPIYLDPDVLKYLSEVASKKGVQVSELANDLLKREIAIIESVK